MSNPVSHYKNFPDHVLYHADPVWITAARNAMQVAAEAHDVEPTMADPIADMVVMHLMPFLRPGKLWVLVEMSERSDYDCEESLVYSKEIGDVYGPFATEAEAEECGKKLNEERGWYEWNGRSYRCDLRDFNAIELKGITS
jgi:hypothetical protein